MFASLIAMSAAVLSPSPATSPSVAQDSPKAAETLRTIPAAEANQGVAIGPHGIYAVSNWTIARYDVKSGQQITKWTGDQTRFPHINSCSIIRKELTCAASNFPAVPHSSSVEIFDPITLKHKRTISLGLGIGSLTWVEWHNGSWWGLYANYDNKGGEAPRDHRHTVLVKFDSEWRRTESWSLPPSILNRVAPMSISGGGWGPDGNLWLSGHDLPELYVTQLPKGGSVLDHLQTVTMEAEGQAIDWDERKKGVLWGIQRKQRKLLEMKVPLD